MNFILPEERERQKRNMLKNLKNGKEQIEKENMEFLLPLKSETIEFKQKL